MHRTQLVDHGLVSGVLMVVGIRDPPTSTVCQSVITRFSFRLMRSKDSYAAETESAQTGEACRIA